MSAWLCDAGVTLRKQIDRRWPERHRASDGWIGDAAHTTGDHVPDPTSKPPGVVRAIDVDEDLQGPNHPDPAAMNRLMNELIEHARKGRDNGRLSYVIFEGRIASGTYRDTFWTWRPYSGSNGHFTHGHVSFTKRGDHRGGPFELPIFYAPRRRWLTRQINRARQQIRAWRARRRALPGGKA